MKKIFTTIFLCFMVATPLASFASTVPAGIQGRLWFSKDPFSAGETITVFAHLYNSSDYRIDGMINLKDGTTTVNKKPFTIDANGGSRVVSFPVLISPGSHTFVATLSEVAVLGADDSTVGINPTLSSATTVSVSRVAAPAPAPATVAASSSVPALVSAAKVLATTSAQVVGETVAQITESAPVSVASRAIPIIGSVEEFRVDQAKDSLGRILSIERKLPVSSSGSTTASNGSSDKPSAWTYVSSGVGSGEIFKSPFRYIQLFLLMVWNFLTTHVIVFYVLIVLILYKIVKGILGVFF